MTFFWLGACLHGRPKERPLREALSCSFGLGRAVPATLAAVLWDKVLLTSLALHEHAFRTSPSGRLAAIMFTEILSDLIPDLSCS